jgi:tetratricopeptide (TPR) repeat protein
MTRFQRIAPVLLFGLLLPGVAEAQTNKDNKWTKDAEKFIGLAMTRQSPEERAQYYQQALEAVRPAFTEDPENAKTWHVAGQAYAGMGQYAEADSAFDRAVAIAPDLAEEIEPEREAGWMEAFQTGVDLMDAQQFDQALNVLNEAQQLYDKRPEALLNIGSIYANQNELDKAEEAFMQAADAAKGDLYAQLDSTAKAQWDRYAEMSILNIAQMRGSRGVDAFTTGDHAAAAEWFRKAAEVNPYSRDYLYNYVQARYALASDHEEAVETDSSKLDQLRPQMVEIYAGLPADIEKVKEFDPTNEQLILILARSQRRHGELTGDTTTGRQTALATLEAVQQIPVEVMELAIAPDETTATVTGKIRNKTLESGAPVAVRVTLLGSEGQTVGEMSFTVNATEKDATADFQQSTEITGQIAGWKYTVSAT